MNAAGQTNDSRQRARSVSIIAVTLLGAVFSLIFRFRRAATTGMALAVGLLLFCAPAQALTIESTTWDIIGLDSNNVSVGPNHFPVGARVCNDSGSTRTITVTFDFVDAKDNYTGDAYINLTGGTFEQVTFTDVPNGECREAFFEVEVTRDSGAYENTRGYTITADDGIDTASTPADRELYIEYLLSQSRNSVIQMYLSDTEPPPGGPYGTAIPNGETMTFMVGSTYYFTLEADTATNGYEQLETFINFPNSVFEVLSVSSKYTADSSATVPDPNPQIYADGCIWDGAPASNNYSSCLSTGKTGGDVVVSYEIKILRVPEAPLFNPAQLSTLIYDFSGSSYHYNADYGVSSRYTNIVNASIDKSFTPVTINPNTNPSGTSTLTFTITNPGPDPITNVNFVDNLPTNGGAGQMRIADTTVTYTDCGSPSPASLTVGDTSLSFSGITIAGLSSGTIEVTVTVDATGTYDNDSENLFIDTYDTEDDAQATLMASDKPPGPSSCTPASSLATWTTITAAPPTPTTQAADVSSATATGVFTAAGSQTVNAGPPTAWAIMDEFPLIGVVPDPSTATTYFQFQVDTSNYGGAQISFDTELNPNGKWASQNDLYVFASPDGTTWTQIYTVVSMTKSLLSHGPIAAVDAGSNDLTGVSYTWFRIINVGQKKAADPATALLSNISIDGCPRPESPTLTKSFSPISICRDSGYSSLTFTFTNPNSTSLTGVGFTDALPAGLLVNNPNGTPTVSCTTGSSAGETITAVAGTSTISMSGATLAANASCSFSVDIDGTLEGDYTNVSNNITSTETGPNTTATGYDTADLAVVAPPVINKTFGKTNLITGESTSLTFSISNPNSHSPLTGVAFTDTLPAGLVVATPNGLTGGCGSGTITATAGTGTISLSGATLAAGGFCTFSVDVTGSTAGIKSNSVTVTSTNGCTGNTATAELLVRAIIPSIGFIKQVSYSATGPWYKYVEVETGSTVYYRFIVENTGETALTGISVTDPDLCASGCSCIWSASIPVADVSDDDHIEYCVPIETITALTGYHPNTATVSSNEVPDKDDTAAYEGFDPTAVTMGNVELVTVKVSDLLSGIGISTLDADGLLNLLKTWDPAAGEWLKDAGRDRLLAAITDYLDPDGDTLVVVLRWETLEERGTIGFYAERRQGGSWARINARMLPGLIAAPMGAQYWLADPDALPGDNYQYRLIEIEARGTTREYGPFDLSVGNALK